MISGSMSGVLSGRNKIQETKLMLKIVHLYPKQHLPYRNLLVVCRDEGNITSIYPQ